MKAKEIAALLDEPACQHNTQQKTGCAKSKPGATAGGCAFDGAQITLLPIADAAHLVHGPIGCAGNSWNNRGTRSSGANLFRLGFTTDLNETDVIMGYAENRLYKAIGHIAEQYNPPAIFVYNTCVPALEGNDIQAICKAASAQWQLDVIAVDAAGFYGSKQLGNRIAGDVLVKQVIGRREPLPKPVYAADPTQQVHDIALIGEYNIAGEFWYVSPLFEQLGYRILSCIAGDARYQEIQTVHRAEATMVVCSRAMLNVARALEQQWNIPWFEGSFYGIADTSNALRQFATMIQDAKLTERTESLIAAEEAQCRTALAPYRAQLAGKKALLYTGGVKSWSIVSALQELGIEVVATGTRKSTQHDIERIHALMGDNAQLLEQGSAQELLGVMQQHQADIMIAGGRNMYTALKARYPFLDINQERHQAYAGYQGMVNLAADLCRTLHSPIWAQVRSQAPWL